VIDQKHVDAVDPDAEAIVRAADAGAPDLAALCAAFVSRLAGSKELADRAAAFELSRQAADPADFTRRVLVHARARHDAAMAHDFRRGRSAQLSAFARRRGF
jgi:hypothetical protein